MSKNEKLKIEENVVFNIYSESVWKSFEFETLRVEPGQNLAESAAVPNVSF